MVPPFISVVVIVLLFILTFPVEFDIVIADVPSLAFILETSILVELFV